MTIITIILTIQRNLPSANQVQKHLYDHEFPDVQVRVFPSAPPKSSKDVILASASGNHFNILRWFSETFPSTPKNRNHIIVCEDDCEFTCGKQKAYPKIKQQIQYLDKHHPEWTTFHIGHCPLGPVFGTDHAEIVRTMIPYTAHCYAMNGVQLAKLLKSHPNKRDWIRPQAIEGWLMVPWKRKFAMYPMIATQNRLPREVANSTIVRKVGLTRSLSIVEQVMGYSVSGICLIVLLIFMVRLLLRRPTA